MMQARPHRAFSLVELLLAIFILGIGIVSIATMFPAGIAQQQRSTDDTLGPVVARNALSILRSRVSPGDFGTCEEWDDDWSAAITDPGNSNPWPTVDGDWMWRRPGRYLSTFSAPQLRGSIDLFAIFDDGALIEGGTNGPDAWATDPVFPGIVPGIPFNTFRFSEQPRVRVLAGERQYPMWSGDQADLPRPQYLWDCMFRRYQGRILVAIFVYRVTSSGQGALLGNELPWHVDLLDTSQASTGSWSVIDNGDPADPAQLTATADDDPQVENNHWQYPGQWVVDQNGIVHRVLRGRRRASDAALRMAAPPVDLPIFQDVATFGAPGVNVNWWDQGAENANEWGIVVGGVVTDIWFLPLYDEQGRRLKPVYVTVQEL